MNIRLVEAFYIGTNGNQLVIHSDEDISEYRVYWTYDNNVNSENKTFLFSHNKKVVDFEFEYSKTQRVFFIVEFDEGSIICGHRILPVAGLYNMRDIGGYKVEDGRRIKWGMGYRSDYLYHLEDTSMEYIESLNIHTIIDYRTPEEILESPNRSINEKASYNFNPNASVAEMAGILQSGETKDSRMDMLEIAKQQIASGNLNAGDDHMINQQVGFTKEKSAIDAFSNTIKVLSDPINAPSFQNCRGGKDRTGFGLLLLEGLLGVNYEDLIYDYMLTARARKEKNKLYYQRFLKQADGDENVARYMYSLFDAKESFIKASLDKILKEYGSIVGFAKEVLNITDEMIESLKSIYLEESY